MADCPREQDNESLLALGVGRGAESGKPIEREKL